jgi:hypothetical protein
MRSPRPIPHEGVISPSEGKSMPTKPRRFTVLDMMVLVAATGVGIALILVYVRTSFDLKDNGGIANNYSFFRLAEDRSFFRFMKTSWTWVHLPILLILTWVPALVFLRFLQPRPHFKRLFRQPGMVACFATLLVMACLGVDMVVDIANGKIEQFVGANDCILASFFGHLDELREVTPYAVATAWALLAMVGRWRGEPSWIDRAGRLIGGFWVALLPWFWVFHYLVSDSVE